MNANPEIRRGIAPGNPCTAVAVLGARGGQHESLVAVAQFAVPVAGLEKRPHIVACT